jgi:hypothetical protein
MADRVADEILRLLGERGPGKTICPSEVARRLADGGDFHPYMEPVREAARGLANDDRIVVTQKGREVEIGEARGPIRLGLKVSDG